MSGIDPGSKSSAEIEREVHQSRAEVEQTLGAIQDRLSPGQLIDQAVGYFRGGGAEFARNLGDSITQNPLPVTLVGVGLAWMMLSGQRSARNGDDVEPRYWQDSPDDLEKPYVGLADEYRTYAGSGADRDTEGFGEQVIDAGRSAKEKLGELGDQARELGAEAGERFGRARRDAADRAYEARERARHHGRRAKQSILRSFNEQPLVLGAIGLAIGAALGAALPPSEAEDRLMGEAGDTALRRAKEVGREQAQKARAAAEAVVDAAREEAGEQGLAPGGEASA